MTLTSFDAMLKDRYPAPGARIKQYVLDERREAAWANDTAPRIFVPEHEDNTGVECTVVGHIPWHFLEMAHCCQVCGALAESYRETDNVRAWRLARAARPPICADTSLLSDEIAPPLGDLGEHPWLKALRGRR